MHSEVYTPEQNVIYSHSLGSNKHNVAPMDWKHMQQTNWAGKFMPLIWCLSDIIQAICKLIKTEEGQCWMHFRSKMAATPLQQEWGDTNIGDFTSLCVMMGIMAGLLGHCLWSSFGLRANDYVINLASLGLWLHHSPWALLYKHRQCSQGQYPLIQLHSSKTPNRVRRISLCFQFCENSCTNELPC